MTQMDNIEREGWRFFKLIHDILLSYWHDKGQPVKFDLY